MHIPEMLVVWEIVALLLGSGNEIGGSGAISSTLGGAGGLSMKWTVSEKGNGQNHQISNLYYTVTPRYSIDFRDIKKSMS